MLKQELIENALALTEKTMEDMYYLKWYSLQYEFLIECFCYYLLSPEFIEKYAWIINWEYYFVWQEERMSATVWKVIYEYQQGNEEPLTNLLSKL